MTFVASSAVNVCHRLAHRRLGDEVEGALGERVDGAGAVGGGERRDDDDRDRLGLAGAQRAQHAEAVEARHVQVERQRVGPVLVAGGQRLVAVGRRGDHVEPLTPEGVGEDAAHQARVVGDDDALRAGEEIAATGSRCYAAASSSAPARANRPSGLSRITRRSPILAIDSIVCGVGGRDGLELLAGDGQDLLDVADDHAGLAGARLDDDDLAELGARRPRCRCATRGRRSG